MIKLKNKVFDETKFIESFQKVYEQDTVPPKIAYWFSDLYLKLEVKEKLFKGIKQKIINKYAIQENGETIVPAGEAATKYHSDLAELYNVEFELDIGKIEYCDGMVVSASDINILSDIIDFTSLKE